MSVVGVTCSANGRDFVLAQCYAESLNSVGLAAVLLPAQPQKVLDELPLPDGLLLAGGGDPHPRLWGEKPGIGLGEVDTLRDDWEIALLQRFLADDKPVLGICRGMQMLNVALGGSLWQDLGARQGAMLHMQTAPASQLWHEIELCGPFAVWLGAQRIAVNSRHHQGVRLLGSGLYVGAEADDALPEGIYMPDKRFVVGVQWHPERLAAGEPGRAVLAAFAAACRVNC